MSQRARNATDRLGDESMLDAVGGAAQCEEPCVIGAARRDWPLGWVPFSILVPEGFTNEKYHNDRNTCRIL